MNPDDPEAPEAPAAPPFAKTVVPIRIEDEMRSSYLDYSMSVIIGRALPDVRDGLKPVHRRILYAMDQEGLRSTAKKSKCAGVVGEVLKRYHPHGDMAVYDALVRMGQPWNLRYPLVDRQGNFGSIAGHPAAHYRYTECRMMKLAEELLVDIDQETVGFVPNFDGTTTEPSVLPAAFPNLLVNGSDGIAVGMATKIPPHNLGEVVDACVAVARNPNLPFEELVAIVTGPDFPTGGTIFGRDGIREAYATGRGRIVVRGRASFEDVNGRRAIVIDEIPYQVNLSRLVEEIAECHREKRIEGIHALRDETSKSGLRVVVELKQDAFEEVVLNQLYKHTSLQSTFGAILLAIVNDRPRVLTLHELVAHYVAHRREVVYRRTAHQLRRARERAHVLEGLRIALDHIDEVIALIRSSPAVEDARSGLMSRFGLSEIQANAILDMRLQRLVGLERDRIEAEYAELQLAIARYVAILASEQLLVDIVVEELLEIKRKYADPRRTRIVESKSDLSIRDLVAETDQIVTLSHLGYIKRVDPDEWKIQRRGGTGKKGMETREEDFVSSMFVANTHAVLMVFTTEGRVYPLNVYEVPEGSRTSKGKPIVNLVPAQPGERIAAVVSMREIGDDDPRDLLFCSRLGIVKRTPLSAYQNIRQGGLIACGVAEGDELRRVELLDRAADVDIMLLAKSGQSIRFPKGGDKGAPVLGRTARGNIGMKLDDGDEVVGMLLVPHGSDEITEEVDDVAESLAEGAEAVADEEPETTLLTITTGGYGKRTPLDEYRLQGRNGKGIIGHGTGPEIGELVGGCEVRRTDELMLVTDTGRVIRILAGEVRLVNGRGSKGVRVMRLEPGERLVDLEVAPSADDDDVPATAPASEE